MNKDIQESLINLGYMLDAEVTEMNALKEEIRKLRAVAQAAGNFLNAHAWEEDNVDEMGENLAAAMNQWKGIK